MLDHRAIVLGVITALTVASLVSLSRVHLGSSIKKLFFGDSPEYAAYAERVDTFVTDEYIMVGWDDPAPLSAASLDRLEPAVAGVRSDRDVGRVDSLASAQRLRLEGDTLVVEAYGEAARANPGDADVLTREASGDPLYGGLLISPDGQHSAAIYELTLNPERTAESRPFAVDEMIAHFEAADFPRAGLHRAGFPVVMISLLQVTYDNLLTIFPVAVVGLLAVVYLLFRRLTPAIVSTGVSMLGVVWTMGLAALIDREFSVLISAAPPVVLVVAFSDVVHIWSAWRTELASGLDNRSAILASAADVGGACLLTSATTFAGFVCLALVPTPAFKVMGVVLAAGVAIALILAVTLVPVVLSFMEPRDFAHQPPGLVSRAVDASVRAMAALAIGSPKAVIAGSAVVMAVSAVGILGLRIETEFIDRFAEDHPVQVDQAWFEEHFAGTRVLDLYIDTPEAEGALDPGLLANLGRAQAEIEQLDSVGTAFSLVDLLQRMHALLGPGDGALPDTRELVAQYLLLFELSGGSDLNRLVDFERRTLRVAVRTDPTGVRSAHETAQQVEAIVARHLGSTVRVDATSLVVLIGWWLDAIVEGQQRGVLVSCVLITLMMALGLRSVRGALWSMVPNTLPLVVLGGVLGFAWETVDSDAFMVAMMAVGIGVDDTIHFLFRYRIEARRALGERGGPEAARTRAIERTYAFAGRAIVMTTVILVVGFLPFATSDYWSLWVLGTLIPLTLLVALVADLLLVPALIQVGWLRFEA